MSYNYDHRRAAENKKLKEELARLQHQNDTKPDRPEYQSQIDPATGLLKDEYQLNTQVDQRGMDAFRDEALRTGPSQWAQMQEASQTDQIAKQSAAAQAQSQNRMAMKGGLSGGAGERMAASQNASMMGQQQRARAGVRMADEQKRMQSLQQLPGMDLQQANFNMQTDKYNIDKALQDHLYKNANDVNAYNEQMRAWAAENTAAATPSSGGGKK